MNDFDQKLGARLKELRLYHGYTQKSIGLLLGVTFQQIQKYETGTNRITACTLHKLKAHYGIEWEMFFKTIRTPILPALPVAEMELSVNTVELLNSIHSNKIRKSMHVLIKEVAAMERDAYTAGKKIMPYDISDDASYEAALDDNA